RLVLRDRAIVFHRMGVWRPGLRAGGGGDHGALESGQFRAELADADARHPQRARLPHSLQPRPRRVQRVAAARHSLAAARIPGRESLGAEAEQLDPMVSRGASLAGSVAARRFWQLTRHPSEGWGPY